MVKFNFENLNLDEMLNYINKLKSDMELNEKLLNDCKNYMNGLQVIVPDDNNDIMRINTIQAYFMDKKNKCDLLKYSRKQKQLKNKLIDLELYLIDKGIVEVVEVNEENNLLLSDEELEEN